jgi:hypothetical protein
MRETGLCENRRTVASEAVEARVLKGIEENLASPELIAEYAREYQRMFRELNSSSAHRRRDLEKRLGNVDGAILKAVDALLGEAPSRDRLTALGQSAMRSRPRLPRSSRSPWNFTPMLRTPTAIRTAA